MPVRCCCNGGGQGVTCEEVPSCINIAPSADQSVDITGDGTASNPLRLSVNCDSVPRCLSLKPGSDLVTVTGTGSSEDPWNVGVNVKISTPSDPTNPITVTGDGSDTNPYIIGVNCEQVPSCLSLVAGNEQIDIGGSGTSGDPWTVSGNVTVQSAGAPDPVVVTGTGTPSDPYAVGTNFDLLAAGILPSCAKYATAQIPLSTTAWTTLNIDGITWDDYSGASGQGIVIPPNTRALVTARIEAATLNRQLAIGMRVNWAPTGGGTGGSYAWGIGYAPGSIPGGDVDVHVTRLINTGITGQLVTVLSRASIASVSTVRVLLQVTLLRQGVTPLSTEPEPSPSPEV